MIDRIGLRTLALAALVAGTPIALNWGTSFAPDDNEALIQFLRETLHAEEAPRLRCAFRVRALGQVRGISV